MVKNEMLVKEEMMVRDEMVVKDEGGAHTWSSWLMNFCSKPKDFMVCTRWCFESYKKTDMQELM